MENLVCPECGHDEFTQTRTTRIEYTLSYDSRAGWYETAESCVDSGDMGDHEIECADCGYECDADALVTIEQYNESE